ncbi:GNAT family N-acetyltransferase [Aestuariibacter salexigens]|uniref:GNAT family N-acetyltransferase n=1 Tax=Aestuariibacter salexigens TaxID=226010 RepID=UPI000426D13A|nr:GNAT family N-acetyltransferase [Aestuariibacter salexigens]
MLEGYQVELIPVADGDLEQVRQWRNQKDVRQFMLNEELISQEQQQAWFNRIKDDPAQRHFVIRFRQQGIGVINIKAVGSGETLETAICIEPGLYIAEPRYRDNLLAFAPTLLINDYCFEVLGVTSLRAVVKKHNEAALRYNARLGYSQTEGVSPSTDVVELRLSRENYNNSVAALKALLSRPTKRTSS